MGCSSSSACASHVRQPQVGKGKQNTQIEGEEQVSDNVSKAASAKASAADSHTQQGEGEKSNLSVQSSVSAAADSTRGVKEIHDRPRSKKQPWRNRKNSSSSACVSHVRQPQVGKGKQNTQIEGEEQVSDKVSKVASAKASAADLHTQQDEGGKISNHGPSSMSAAAAADLHTQQDEGEKTILSVQPLVSAAADSTQGAKEIHDRPRRRKLQRRNRKRASDVEKLYQGWISHPNLGDRVPVSLKIEIRGGKVCGTWDVVTNGCSTTQHWCSVFEKEMQNGADTLGHEAPYDLSRWTWTSPLCNQYNVKFTIEVKRHGQFLQGEVLRLPRLASGERPTPVARWNFRNKKDKDAFTDEIGGKKGYAMNNKYSLDEDGLVLRGDCCIYSEPLGLSMREKTLEVWVELFNLEQREVGIMSFGEMSRPDAAFDGLVFNQRHEAEWIPCSEFFNRYETIAGGAEKQAGIVHHMAITYAEDNTITLYRDGLQYGSSYKVADPGLLKFSEDSRIVFGARHYWPDADRGADKFVGELSGRIVRAALYDRALSQEEIALNFGAGSLKLWETPGDRRMACESPEDEANMDALRAEFPDHVEIKDTEERSITLQQLKRVFRFAAETCHTWGYTSEDEKARSMKTLDLYGLCKWLIKPATVKLQCSLVELMASGPQRPKWFVSHWWGETIVDFVRCLSRHASLRSLDCEAAFWVCAYANRQHSIGSEIPKDLKSTSFHKAMKLAVGVLLVLDESAKALTRIWCAFEQFEAVEISGAYQEEKSRTCLLDIATCHKGDAVVLTEGPVAADEIDQKVTLAKASREKRFPKNIIEQGLKLDLKGAEATQTEDKDRIVKWMDQRGGVDEANRRLRSIFAISSWRQCVVDGTVAEMKLPMVLSEDNHRRTLKFDFSFLWKFSNDDADQFAKGIPDSVLDLEVDFEWCIALGNAGLDAIADALGRTKVQTLHLNLRSCDQLSWECFANLAAKLPNSIQSLGLLLHKELDDKCVVQLADHLKQKPGLSRLQLCLNGCSKLGTGVIEQLVEKAPPQLMELDLNIANCPQMKNIDVIQFSAKLPQSLEKLHLNCDGCRDIDSEGLLHLASELDRRSREISKISIHAAPHLMATTFEYLKEWIKDQKAKKRKSIHEVKAMNIDEPSTK